MIILLRNFIHKLAKFKPDSSIIGASSRVLKFLSISYVIFLFVVFFLFSNIYSLIASNSKDFYQMQYMTNIVSFSEKFETDIEIMDTYCLQLLQTPLFRRIVNKADANIDYLNNGNQLSEDMAVNIYAESLLPLREVYCYLPSGDYILTQSHFMSAYAFYHWSKNYPAALQSSFFNMLMDPESYRKFLTINTFQEKSGDRYYLYIVNMDDLSFMKANARMCFLFNKDELFKLFNYSKDNFGSFLSILDSDGNSILTDSTFDFDKSIYNFNSDYHDVHVSDGTNDMIVTIAKYHSDQSGLDYYYSFPSYDNTPLMIRRKTTFVISSLIALIFGLILAALISMRQSRPIKRLGEAYEEAANENLRLAERLVDAKPIIIRSYTRQLLSTQFITHAELNYILDFLEIPAHNHVYNCLYINTYKYGDGVSSEEYDELSTAIEKYIISELGSAFYGNLYFYSPTPGSLAILLYDYSTSEAELLMKAQSKVVQIHDYLVDNFKLWISAGIGKNVKNIASINKAFIQAREAVEYSNKNYTFIPYEFLKNNATAFYYPQEMSNRLIHYLTTGNEELTMNLLSFIHKENTESLGLPIYLQRFLLSDIRNTILKARFELPKNANHDAVAYLDEHLNDHLTFALLDDLALRLCRIFAQLESESKETDETQIEAISNYIKRNFSDPNLSLAMLSTEFNISETYFSHLFKEKMGTNFSTYLENLRMAESMRLLKETDTSLSEIYYMVGYNNPGSFRRAFKKVYGVTPGSLRETPT